MSDQNRKLRQWEVRWARAFLHAVHGNESNGYLLRAVIAWMRAEGGGRYNPLNLKSGGRLLYFRTLASGAQYAVRRLLNPGPKAQNYQMIARVLRRSASTDAQQQAQALDFLYHLALSNWDAQHYGMQESYRTIVVDPHTHKKRLGPTKWRVDPDSPLKNLILAFWYPLTGMNIPKAWFVDAVVQPPPPPKPKPYFRQDRAWTHAYPHAEYINPYHVVEWYKERPHQGDFILQPE